jgi:hypothetical protein
MDYKVYAAGALKKKLKYIKTKGTYELLSPSLPFFPPPQDKKGK